MSVSAVPAIPCLCICIQQDIFAIVHFSDLYNIYIFRCILIFLYTLSMSTFVTIKSQTINMRCDAKRSVFAISRFYVTNVSRPTFQPLT